MAVEAQASAHVDAKASAHGDAKASDKVAGAKVKGPKVAGAAEVAGAKVKGPKVALGAIADWQTVVDPKTGSTYYYNTETGESSWVLIEN